MNLRSLRAAFTERTEIFWTRFDALSKREKRLATSVLAVIAILVFDGVVVRPVYRSLVSLNQKIKAEEKKASQNMRRLARKSDVDALYSRLSQGADQGALPSEQIRSSMLHDIESSARAKSVYLAEVKPQSPLRKEHFERYPVRVQMEGKLEDVMLFFLEILRTPKLYTLENMRMVPHSEDVNKIRATATVVRSVILPEP